MDGSQTDQEEQEESAKGLMVYSAIKHISLKTLGHNILSKKEKKKKHYLTSTQQ